MPVMAVVDTITGKLCLVTKQYKFHVCDFQLSSDRIQSGRCLEVGELAQSDNDKDKNLTGEESATPACGAR